MTDVAYFGGLEDDWSDEDDTRNDPEDIVRLSRMSCGVGTLCVWPDWLREKTKHRPDGPATGDSGTSVLSSWFACWFLMQVVIGFDMWRTGLDCSVGIVFSVDVSRLGAIISSLITSGLRGTTPVFLNVALIFSRVSVATCVMLYISRNFDFVTFWCVLHSYSSRASLHHRLTTLKITMSRPWYACVECEG